MKNVLAALFAIGLIFPLHLLAQHTEAKVEGASEYKLSPQDAELGFMGSVHIGLTINKDGTATGLRFYGGPSWPCESKVKNDEIEALHKSIEQHVKGTKFTPEVKDGKPRSTDGQIVFKVVNPGLESEEYLNIGTIKESMVEYVPRNTTPNGPGLSMLEVFVDESGTVKSAGLSKGPVITLKAARDRACASRFKPLIRSGKAVKFVGVLLMRS